MNQIKEGATVGIDLGTTYSSVGVFQNQKVEVIANEHGNRITPSYVSFNQNGERLIGDAAKNQLIKNCENTVYDSKRLIGRDWLDESVQNDIKTFPFTVINKNCKPHVVLQTSQGQKNFSAEEISAMILSKMKQTAEDYLGQPVTKAVVTVPAYFNDAQRIATKTAGKIAGLDIIRILNEPTAAAVAYGMDKKNGESTIMIFDLGGGTIDVSILKINNGIFDVIVTDGDIHLGGEDFDQRVIDYFIKLYKDKNKDFSNDKRAIQRLRREVEKAKRALSTCYQVQIDVECFIQGEDFSEYLTRAKFEELNKDLFQSAIEPVLKAMNFANITANEINEVVLVGGSTRIPKIQALVKEIFCGKELVKSINPDEAIAYGATAMASVLSGENLSSSIILKDVTPLTLGVMTLGNIFETLISRGTSVPTVKSKYFTTVYDNQDSVCIDVLEGERSIATENHLLGKFNLMGISPAPRGFPLIGVTFKIDEDGILEVTAIDMQSRNAEKITIADIRNQLTVTEIARMIKEAELFAEEDRIFKQNIELSLLNRFSNLYSNNNFLHYRASMNNLGGFNFDNGSNLISSNPFQLALNN